MHFPARFFSGAMSRFPGMICLTVAVVLLVVLAGGRGVTAAKRVQGNNVCTRVKSVAEVHRIPIPGTRTQTVRYTTFCGLQGRCSRYRNVYVQNYREVSRTTYRVVQECCAGWVQRGRRCVKGPPPDTAAGTRTTLAPTVNDGSRYRTTNPSRQSPTRPSAGGWGPNRPGTGTGTGMGTGTGTGMGTGMGTGTGTGMGTGTGAATGGVGAGGRQGWDRGRQGPDTPSPGAGGQGERGQGNTGRDIDKRPGRSDPDGTSSSKTKDGDENSYPGNNYPGNEMKPATPDTKLPQKDSGMMFLTGMLCGVGVLSVAAFVVLFMMYRQRRHMDGRVIGIPFLQSTRYSSGSFRKSKLLALAQSIRSGEVKILREPTKKGNANDQRQYTDIEDMDKGILFTKCDSSSSPSLEIKHSKEKKPSIKIPTVMTITASSSWSHLNKERELPPKPRPPTYAIIQRVSDLKGSDPDIPGSETDDPSSVDLGYSTVYAEPEGVPNKGNSHTVPRDFNMGPPRYIICESQHIYADIHRKSKASTWSCSKKSRPKSSASAGDEPRQEGPRRSGRSLSRTLSRNSLGSIVKRGSRAGSSGYSSLRGSRENIYDAGQAAEERQGPPSPNIYSETIPKDTTPIEPYDRLDLSHGDSFKTEYDKLSRGFKMSRGNGIVKSFSKKYEKIAAMRMSKR